jgi:hypothetical protein
MSVMIHLTSLADAAQIAAYETGDAAAAKGAVVATWPMATPKQAIT